MFDYIPHSFGPRHLAVKKPEQYIITQERPNYKEYSYCNRCKRNRPKDSIHCSECNYMVRRRPVSRKKLDLPRIE